MSFSSHPLHPPKTQLFPSPAKRAEAAILSLGNDERLLQTRAGVLRLTGCEVVSSSPLRALDLLGGRKFALVVFGHTLTDRQVEELADFSRNHYPETKLLLTYLGFRSLALQQRFDAVIECWIGPVALLRSATSLLAKDGGRFDADWMY